MPTVTRKEQKLGRDPSLEPQRKCHPANTLLLVFWHSAFCVVLMATLEN